MQVKYLKCKSQKIAIIAMVDPSFLSLTNQCQISKAGLDIQHCTVIARICMNNAVFVSGCNISKDATKNNFISTFFSI
jgi:hypothetical protein